MAKSTKEKFTKQRKPFVALICEGRNKTESKFFSHFKKRDSPFNLRVYPSESTDPISMFNKAKQIATENELDSRIGDKVFCLIDIDLSQTQIDKINKIKNLKPKIKCQIELILSNPCFEIWFLYYFTKSPKIETSSHNVKKQLKNYIPLYSENYDVLAEYNLENNHTIALNNAELRNQQYDSQTPLIDKNPYTEVGDLIGLLLNFNNDK